MLYLRSQSALLSQLQTAQRDTGKARWTDAEGYAALSDALLSWHNRVYCPMWYDVDWSASERYYALPAYMHPPFYPQAADLTPANPDDPDNSTVVWSNLPAYSLEASGDGTFAIRWGVAPRDARGRVGYNLPAGPLPSSVPVLNAILAIDATSAVLTGTPIIPDVGFVLIEYEWMLYRGVTRAATTTLTNLVRGWAETTAVQHAGSTAVNFGVAAPRQDLFNVLLDHARANLHEMYLTNGAPSSQQKHQQMVSYYRQKVAEFWRSWTPESPGRLRPTSFVGVY